MTPQETIHLHRVHTDIDASIIESCISDGAKGLDKEATVVLLAVRSVLPSQKQKKDKAMCGRNGPLPMEDIRSLVRSLTHMNCLGTLYMLIIWGEPKCGVNQSFTEQPWRNFQTWS